MNRNIIKEKNKIDINKLMKNTKKMKKASQMVFRHQQKNPVIIINKNIKITIKVKIKDVTYKNKIRKIILEEKDIST